MLSSLARWKFDTVFPRENSVPRPLPCFNCNRNGHADGHGRGKLRCSICGGEHKCSEHSAAAPMSQNGKLKSVAKLSYADACEAHRIAQKSSRSEYGFTIRFSPSSEKDI